MGRRGTRWEEVDGGERESVKEQEAERRTRETSESPQRHTGSRQAEDGRMKGWSTWRRRVKTGSEGEVEEREKRSGRRGRGAHGAGTEYGIQ